MAALIAANLDPAIFLQGFPPYPLIMYSRPSLGPSRLTPTHDKGGHWKLLHEMRSCRDCSGVLQALHKPT